MVSEKIKNAAEKTMPKEKRFVERVQSFFGKKSRLLIASGFTAVVLLYPIYWLVSGNLNGRYNLLLAALDFVELTAAGVFFANIDEFSLKKYGIAVSVWSVVLHLATSTLYVVIGSDPTTWTEIIPYWFAYIAEGLLVCSTMVALSVLLAYLVACCMKKEE